MTNMEKVVAAMNPIKGYVKRSFCLIEVYAAVAGNVNLAVQQDIWTRWQLEILLAPELPSAKYLADKWVGPIDCKEATTRNSADKDMIDGYIASLDDGHALLNKVVTQAILDS